MPSNPDCIFCKIVAGALPSARIYEDDDTLAFMDIGPLVKGHTLVIPKAHHVTIDDTPPGLLQGVIAVVQRIARAQRVGLGADGVNVHQANGTVAGQVVPHIHFHVVPRFDGDGYSFRWQAGAYDSPEAMEATAERIRSGLASAG